MTTITTTKTTTNTNTNTSTTTKTTTTFLGCDSIGLNLVWFSMALRSYAQFFVLVLQKWRLNKNLIFEHESPRLSLQTQKIYVLLCTNPQIPITHIKTSKQALQGVPHSKIQVGID